eukprot:GFYU01002625.1.p1 GENE.GFYU01002625.1~~GFYU01002625.1.p1  ORF type:complete len:448 (-),score=104.15 GFYU01002625.1:84-1427(-)
MKTHTLIGMAVVGSSVTAVVMFKMYWDRRKKQSDKPTLDDVIEIVDAESGSRERYESASPVEALQREIATLHSSVDAMRLEMQMMSGMLEESMRMSQSYMLNNSATTIPFDDMSLDGQSAVDNDVFEDAKDSFADDDSLSVSAKSPARSAASRFKGPAQSSKPRASSMRNVEQSTSETKKDAPAQQSLSRPDTKEAAPLRPQTPPPTPVADPLEALLEEADKLHSDGKKEETYHLLYKRRDDFTSSEEFLWRLARACFDMSTLYKDSRKEYLMRGLEYAQLSVDKGGKLGPSFKWFAIITGEATAFQGTSEKIKSSFVFKQNIERAIELDPKDASSHHCLGRWCVEISRLSWLERKAAGALFGEPPNATMEEARDHFARAEDISPGFWKTNLLCLAKCEKELGNHMVALDHGNAALAIETKTEEDREAHDEAKVLVEKWTKKYLPAN